MDDDKKCLVCGKDGMMALFGVLLGAAIILMSLDTLRRMRIERTSGLEIDGSFTEEVGQ